ncbi:type I polyketide synthase [Cellulosilyticum ruminicola]|uniref:type I polyketide synthase n=1 Tax=Cellulosilyticum ruminicola TaxID=425254 RepID=UPI0006CFBA92|nr:type I polyketide synthase [Cellulosilyticum ruminicola]
MKIETQYTGLEIAVIGMSGRFPGANDLREFWENLVDGIESISFFTEEELLEAGVDPEQLSKPNYVKAKGVFPNVEYFDSDFFNYTPKDAQTIDPQVRVLHEEVYHALEDAGYASEQYRGSIGVFLGAANNIAWETQTLKTTIDDGGYGVATLQLNDKDHAATRIAYSLNLHGPSTTSYSACSTSLYAVDLACRNILTGSCHIAVAGGSNLTLPSKNGYLYDEGMIKSPDGHCRAFDHLAKGTVEGNGVGVVVLKGLQQAIKDGDHIYSIIKGTAVNNDGNRKVGYTAPSIEGQTEVIRRALKMGGVQANSVSYIESHGTGTVLGDPIEFTALKKVYEVDNNIQQVGIGALKPNIGHLDVAAGIASFIKTSLSLAHKQIPATINFSKINENIDIDNSNFYIVDQTKPWERTKVPNKEQCYMPLRAGISSFGIGGTNVHMILEEAPIQKYETQQRGTHLLCLSAKTETALINMKKSYLEYLNQEGENINPAHLAWSVHTGLRSFNKRYSTIYHTISELKDILEEDLEHMEKSTSTIPNGKPTVYFLFPGQGSQYSGMAKGLYETQATFRKVVDECLLEVEANGIDNLREILFEHSAENNKLLQETDMAQISLFIIEYALAQLLISWGIQPKGMTGHSLGEYVAAALAGVFTLKDGIRIICQRGVIMKKMPEGAMLGVNASEEQVLALLGENVSIAAVNGENQCTVSGSNEAIKSFEEKCKRKKIITRKLHTSHAFHSELMQDAVEPFETVLRDVELQSPKIPYISNLTGTWIKNEEATDATYYTKHLKQTVHFKQGIEQMMLDERVVVIEVGPGHTLSTFARQIGREHLTGAVNLIHHPKEEVSDEDYLTQSIGKLWGFGVVPEWKSYYKDEKHTRIKLPLYPFEKKKYPISVDAFYGLLGNNNVAQYRKVEVAPNQEEEDDLVAQENWEKVLRVKANATDEQRVCLVLTDNIERIEALSERLPRWRMIIFESGDQYTFRDSLGGYIRSGNALDLYLLCYELREYALLPDEIILSYKDEESTYSNLSELMQILRNEYKEKLPEVVVLSPYSPLMNYPRLVAKVQSELATQEELSLRLIDAGTQNQEQLSVWAEIIQKEITAENNPYPVVMYLNGERLVPKLSILDKNELVNNNYFSERNILVVCNEENVDQVKVRFYQEEYTDKLKVLPYKLVDEGYKRGILKEIVSELSQQQKSYLEQYGIPDMSEAHKLMDEYTIRLVFEYINGLMTLNVGTRFSQEEMIEALRIEPTFEKYVDYFIHIFKEDGLIKPLEDGMQYIVTEAIKYLRNKEVIKCDLQKLTNLFDGQLELLEHCVSHFEKALSGEESALGVLYPPEQKDLLIKTYAGTYQEKEDELIRSIFAKLVERLIQEKGKIRILEVGGGYGTIPRYIATLLKDTEVEYYFTDVGKTYIEDFKKFAVQEDLKCFSYGLFDVSKSPKEQGLEEESFDLVFAYNVIHATYQLQTSLNNMQQILKPGGVMCVLERTCLEGL